MTDELKNVYTEDQHFALLASAVERETSALTEKAQEFETQIATLTEENATLKTTVDTVEASAESEKARADAAEKALADFQSEIAELAAIETRKEERVALVKAANESLTDEYFTAERAQRWAEMSEDTFTTVLETIREAASAVKSAGDGTEPSAEQLAEQARETAAFKGGRTVTNTTESTTSQLFRATGFLPAGV